MNTVSIGSSCLCSGIVHIWMHLNYLKRSTFSGVFMSSAMQFNMYCGTMICRYMQQKGRSEEVE